MTAEILAPAGSPEALTAALRCGADAVYLGARVLNARRGAQGFSDEELCRAAELCHAYGAKLYLTMNILTSDEERQQTLSLLDLCGCIGVDALIVQDMGVARLARECCDIPLHASTQMSVQTSAGAAVLSEMGFVRMVAPRELTRGELTRLRRETTLEIEMFVHGALCMSVSGQCLMSAFFGGRSGNRGLCAQPCRLPFRAEGGTGHDLSLKDLSLLPHLRALRDLGVRSFKIEGRMKRPEYVAAAVTACRRALEGADEDDVFDALRSVFSRSGFTDGYFSDKRGRAMFGTRQKEDVTAAERVLPTLRSLYEKPRALYGTDFFFHCHAGEPVTLEAAAGEKRVFVRGETPSAARSRALQAEDVRRQLDKCGGTLFYAERIDIDLQDGLFLPASALNALRRDALEMLREAYSRPKQRAFRAPAEETMAHTAGRRQVWARFASAEQIPEELSADKVILPLYCGAETIARAGAAAEVPRGIFERQDAVRCALMSCRALGVTEGMFASADGLQLLREAELAPVAFFGSNVFNTLSLAELEARGAVSALLSPELTLRQAQTLGGAIPRGVLAYGRVPLMLTRNCPQRNGKDCDSCARTGRLTDRMGETFPIECRSGCAEILNSRPVYLLDKQAQFRNIDFLLLYFTTESREECRRILSAVRTAAPPVGDFTRGLAFRGVE